MDRRNLFACFQRLLKEIVEALGLDLYEPSADRTNEPRIFDWRAWNYLRLDSRRAADTGLRRRRGR